MGSTQSSHLIVSSSELRTELVGKSIVAFTQHNATMSAPPYYVFTTHDGARYRIDVYRPSSWISRRLEGTPRVTDWRFLAGTAWVSVAAHMESMYREPTEADLPLCIRNSYYLPEAVCFRGSHEALAVKMLYWARLRGELNVLPPPVVSLAAAFLPAFA
eukprot:TRINITY_DN21496_c0_g1_i1.p2 TRINITY_DN21496_c0_g1~~TRINITY_DN21496_c0_g1_i1.p2  ORF type:complete len:168 (-),score=23.01 TRINITY_DN21496_c0_g1_i1:174-650(-)